MQAQNIGELWKEDQNGQYIGTDDTEAMFISNGVRKSNIVPVNGDIWAGIRAWMEINSFYPNIWTVNERGNIMLRGDHGEDLGGIV